MQEPTDRQAQTTPDCLSLLDVAIRAYQHAEAVIQARLYNFLFADSILLLSWAAVYAGADLPSKESVLISLALLSATLGLFWSILGLRHRKFLFVHTQIIDDIEQQLPIAWRVHERITLLQEGETVRARGHDYRLNLLDKAAKSRNLGVIAPLAMTGVSIFLLWFSVQGP